MVVAFAAALVDTLLGTVAAVFRVPPDVLQAAKSATHAPATVRCPMSVPALLAIDAGAARFIRTLPRASGRVYGYSDGLRVAWTARLRRPEMRGRQPRSLAMRPSPNATRGRLRRATNHSDEGFL